MAEKANPTQNTDSTQVFSNKSITAVELAELVIETTSVLIPVIDNLDGDTEAKELMKDALVKLQKKAIEYAIAAAKRAQRRNSTWRRGRTWRR